MTGFGRGEASAEGISVTLEMKTLNSRYCDINIRLPQNLQDREHKLRERIQQHIDRGKINVSVRIDTSSTGVPDVKVKEQLVEGYTEMLNNLRNAASIEQQVKIEHLLQFDELFESREQDPEEIEKAWNLTKQAADQAIENLNKMRRLEGEQLKNDLVKQTDKIDDLLKKIMELAKDRVPDARDRLRERIQKLMDDDQFDKERLELEVAVLADKMDITEEIVRMQSHIKFFREALEQKAAVGRRLNFLSQEMNRELNTIGSKANNSEISHFVVHAKEALEKIREQVQNIE